MTLPLFAKGSVIKGFGRGSKELGCPTANLPVEVVNKLPEGLQTGIYFGWASIENGEVHKMVMSIGWNPYYKNSTKSMEAHIIHEFPSDFYGSLMKVCILGYIRPEKSFDSLDDLIKAIRNDIEESKKRLDETENLAFKTHQFFKS